MGYFLIMIIFMIIAVVTAKGKGWIWYTIGAVLQLIAQLGSAASGTDTAILWFIYFVLLIITAIIIVRRRNT